MNKIFAALGVNDFKSYMTSYITPILLIDFLFLFLFMFAFTNPWVKWGGCALFFIILVVVFAYPMIIIDNQTRDIDENLHYFITYAGALSTINLDRKEMFRDLSEKVRYREISKVFKKLLYLVENIKLDFPTASYKVAALFKTEHFSRFMERMGIALSFNSNVASFFLTEQKALMNSYEIVYKEGLEKIKVVQDIFTSIVMAFAFVLATVLLMPFLTGINSEVFLLFGIFGMFMIDGIVFAFAKFFLPVDKLYHKLGYEKGRHRVFLTFLFCGAISLFISPFIIFLEISLMLKFAIIFTPMLGVGFYSNYQEKLVRKRDLLFPPFIRSLGDVHQSKGGTLTTTIETLLPHNFGILDNMLERVYKRLKITKDKFNSWFYFNKESGSALISEFMDIFITVVYRGGSAQLAGEIVSDNMSRINGLRDIKNEYAGGFKGGIYGSFFAIALTIYVSLLISILLLNIFNSMTEGIDGMAANMINGIFPSGLETDLVLATSYVAIILFIHAFVSGFLLKEVDGGSYFSMFQTFVMLLWMGAIIEIVVTVTFNNMFAGSMGV